MTKLTVEQLICKIRFVVVRGHGYQKGFNPDKYTDFERGMFALYEFIEKEINTKGCPHQEAYEKRRREHLPCEVRKPVKENWGKCSICGQDRKIVSILPPNFLCRGCFREVKNAIKSGRIYPIPPLLKRVKVD